MRWICVAADFGEPERQLHTIAGARSNCCAIASSTTSWHWNKSCDFKDEQRKNGMPRRLRRMLYRPIDYQPDP
jgi:putative flippase GtrA